MQTAQKCKANYTRRGALERFNGVKQAKYSQNTYFAKLVTTNQFVQFFGVLVS
nr:MAG TPA: hypothetical protein [Caudoviricetes sp.]